MKIVILCGGRGARMNEYTQSIPKSMVMIQDKPLLWYIIRHYQKQLADAEFILCLGYKGEMIRDYFIETDFNIQYVDTGEYSTKTERLKQIEHLITEDTFMVAYGDDLCDVDINKLLKFHESHGKMLTLVSVQLKSDFGILKINSDNEVKGFFEKPILEYWMNGGYYVMNKSIFDYLRDIYGDFESSLFPQLAENREIHAYDYTGFWKSCNLLKDVQELQNEKRLLNW